MYNLLASSFLITLTGVVLRNQFFKVAHTSQEYQASMHFPQVSDTPAQSSSPSQSSLYHRMPYIARLT